MTSGPTVSHRVLLATRGASTGTAAPGRGDEVHPVDLRFRFGKVATVRAGVDSDAAFGVTVGLVRHIPTVDDPARAAAAGLPHSFRRVHFHVTLFPRRPCAACARTASRPAGKVSGSW
jgi:hypothetical protein